VGRTTPVACRIPIDEQTCSSNQMSCRSGVKRMFRWSGVKAHAVGRAKAGFAHSRNASLVHRSVLSVPM